MKIAYKLYIVIAISLITIIGLGLVSYSGVKKISTSFDTLVQFPIPSMLRLSDMTEAFILSVEEAHSYRLYGLAESKESYYKDAKEFDRLMAELKRELHYGTPDILSEDTRLIDSISTKVASLNQAIIADFANYEQPDTRANALSADPFSEEKDSVVSLLHQYRDLEEGEIKNASLEVDTSTDETIEIILIASLLLLLIIAISNSLLARSITKPLHALEEAARKLGEGDLTNRITVTGKDELSLLANTFNTMTDNVQQSYAFLESKIQDRIDELEHANAGLKKIVAEQTVELEKAKASLDETVVKRTVELEKKAEELKSLNTAVTSRELKMAELKDEIDDLLK